MTEPGHEMLDRAMQLHREGQLAAAASLYGEILRLEPLNFDATNLLGSICLRQGEFDEALAIIGRALQIDPQSVEAQLNFGYALSRLDRLDEAMASFWRAIEIRPDFAEAHGAIAMLSAALERHDEAVASWRRAIEIEPGSAELHNNLGAALSELGRHEEAVASYRRAIELQPRSAELHDNLGLALASTGRPEEAAASYRRAIELEPGYGPAHHNLGVALSRLGRVEEALASYRRAIEIEPYAAEAHNNLGVALSRLGRHEEAAASYLRAIEIAPDYAEAYNNLGNARCQLDRVGEAVASYRRAVEIKPDYAEAHYSLGNALGVGGRPDEAVASYRRAIDIRPNYAEAHNHLGSALRDARRFDEAVGYYRQAIAIKPDHAEAHCNLGIALKVLGRIDEARQAIEKSIELAPARIESYASLAEAKRFRDGDPHLAAMKELARNMASLSGEEQIRLHFALGKIFADLDEQEQSFRHLLEGNALKRRQIVYDEAAVLWGFDRIRGVFTRELMRDKQGRGHPSPVPVFILGMPRSGTTLVEQILASHPSVYGAGELTELVDIVAGLGGPRGVFANFPENVRAMSKVQLRDLGTRYLERVSALAPAASRITDKMPANFRFAGLIHLALPNARIIHTRRDPIDTCLSCFSLLFSGDQPHTYDLGELGRYYRAYAALMEHWCGVLPQGVMIDVQYEELVTDFERQARRIVAHCGLDWDAACLDFHKTHRPVPTASAVQVRQPIYRTSIGRWQSCGDMLGPLLAALEVISGPG